MWLYYSSPWHKSHKFTIWSFCSGRFRWWILWKSFLSRLRRKNESDGRNVLRLWQSLARTHSVDRTKSFDTVCYRWIQYWSRIFGKLWFWGSWLWRNLQRSILNLIIFHLQRGILNIAFRWRRNNQISKFSWGLWRWTRLQIFFQWNR